MNIIPEETKKRKDLEMRAGDTVRVWVKIEEKGKIRLQAFEGLVIARKHGSEPGATFTVRKISGGIGVERVFPLFSPLIDRIEILRRSKVRKSKLYYIREKAVKEIKKKMRRLTPLKAKKEESQDELMDKKAEEDIVDAENEINNEAVKTGDAIKEVEVEAEPASE